MKKGWKCICTIGGVAVLCAGASFVKDYCNMKKMEGNLDSLPPHKLREKLSDIQEDRRKAILTIPKDMPVLEYLHVCKHVPHGNVRNRDACK